MIIELLEFAAVIITVWHRGTIGTYRLHFRARHWHHCAVALSKLLTPVCLCHQAVVPVQRAVML